MTSALKIAANRRNAKNSTGPRTRRGKSRASRNSVRHGLERVNFGVAGLSKKVERLAKVICKDDPDPFRYEQAVVIAESQIRLARVRAARISALEGARSSVSGLEVPTGDGEGALMRGVIRKSANSAANARRVMPELLSLERYERRALSRRKRAIRRFDALGE